MVRIWENVRCGMDHRDMMLVQNVICRVRGSDKINSIQISEAEERDGESSGTRVLDTNYVLY